jgi:hemerythrin-like metal-binding protein
MSRVEWSDAYRVGIREIDEQHSRFLQILNSVQATDFAADPDSPKAALTDLGEYAAFHFQTEERLFAEFGYAAASGHIGEHREFERKIAEFREGYRSTRTFNPAVVADFLRDWFIRHILISGRKYVDFFRGKGLK